MLLETYWWRWTTPTTTTDTKVPGKFAPAKLLRWTVAPTRTATEFATVPKFPAAKTSMPATSPQAPSWTTDLARTLKRATTATATAWRIPMAISFAMSSKRKGVPTQLPATTPPAPQTTMGHVSTQPVPVAPTLAAATTIQALRFQAVAITLKQDTIATAHA